MPQELPFPTRDAIRHRFGAAYFADNFFMGAKSMSYKDRSRKKLFWYLRIYPCHKAK